MKKLNLFVLSASVLMAMGLTACGETPAASSSVPSSEPVASSSVKVIDYAALAKEAYGTVSATYDAFATAGVSEDVELASSAKVTSEGVEYTFAITYAISDEAKNYLAISTEGGKTILKVTRDAEDHTFTKAITASVSYDGEVKFTKTINVIVVKDATVSVSALYTMKKGDTIQIEGTVTRMVGKAFVVTDATGAAYIYTTKDWEGVEVGVKVKVLGSVSPYNGLYQIKPDSVEVVAETGDSYTPVIIDAATDMTNAAGLQSKECTVEGLVTSISVAAASSSNTAPVVTIVLSMQKEDKSWTTISVRTDSRYTSDEEWASWKDYISVDETAGTYAVSEAGEALIKKSGMKISGYVGWYNAIQIANGKVADVYEWTADKPAVPEPAVVSTTIAELNKKTAPEDNVAYTVTGIYDGYTGAASGSCYLVDPTTGESILVYSLTGDESALAWDNAEKYNFTKLFTAKTTLADVKPGELITIKCLNQYYASKSLPEIVGVVTAHVASAATYKASVTTEEKDATVSLSKTEDIVFGEEIEVTGSKEGYAIDAVTVTTVAGESSINPDAEGKYKFSATCKNEVKVTFKDASVPVTSTEITAAKLNVTSSYGSGTATIDGVGWAFNQCMKDSDGRIQMNNKTPLSTVYNTTALPKAIKNVVVTFKAAVTASIFWMGSGASEISDISQKEFAAISDTTVTYTPTATTDTYFALGHGSNKGACYIASIVINYVD